MRVVIIAVKTDCQYLQRLLSNKKRILCDFIIGFKFADEDAK